MASTRSRERVRCAEAAVLVHQQLTDVRAGLDERAEGVEWFGEGQGGLQGVAGGGPLARDRGDRGLQQPASPPRCAGAARAWSRPAPRGSGCGRARACLRRRRPTHASRRVLRCRRSARQASPGRCVPRRRARAAARRGTPASPSRRSVAGLSGCRRSPSVPVAARPARRPGRRGRTRRPRGPRAARSAPRVVTAGPAARASAVRRSASAGSQQSRSEYPVIAVAVRDQSEPSQPWSAAMARASSLIVRIVRSSPERPATTPSSARHCMVR